VQGKTPGSLSIDATTIFDDGIQIPVVKLYTKGVYNQDITKILSRNSRAKDWFESDIFALFAACKTASIRVQELCARYGLEYAFNASNF
jgi:5-oxoprolinase (ATP-hydrolysing)